MNNGGQKQQMRRALGFSLLELMVVVVLLAGLLTIVIPTINSLQSLDLKNEIVKLAGLSSEVYALAALSGKTHRIVFNLDEQTYWVEQKSGDAGEISPELGYEELMKMRVEETVRDQRSEGADRFIPKFKKVEGRIGEKLELAKNVVFHGLWAESMDDVVRTGQAFIYFFSEGYTQSCFVSLAIKGEEDSAMYLALSPLTGSAKIDFGEPEISDLINAEGEM